MQKIHEYHELFRQRISEIDLTALSQAVELVGKTYAADKQIFTAGNGGSAAVAVHLAADFGKNVAGPNDKPPRILTLCANVSAITALANDCGYETVFEGQLRNLMRPGDLVVLISAGGNSPNVVKAAQYAKANGAAVLGLTGFDGGELQKLSDVNLHVPSRCYEIVEDVHSFFSHALVYASKKTG
ncbi:MAG: SIS domain-containing protein [Planctomycetaceae bacterium]|nr:SIS domain-containing protein [Planctomycetaceae bacterium]